MKTYLVQRRFDLDDLNRSRKEGGIGSGSGFGFGGSIAVDAEDPEEAVLAVAGAFGEKTGSYLVTETTEVVVNLLAQELG